MGISSLYVNDLKKKNDEKVFLGLIAIKIKNKNNGIPFLVMQLLKMVEASY